MNMKADVSGSASFGNLRRQLCLGMNTKLAPPTRIPQSPLLMERKMRTPDAQEVEHLCQLVLENMLGAQEDLPQDIDGPSRELRQLLARLKAHGALDQVDWSVVIHRAKTQVVRAVAEQGAHAEDPLDDVDWTVVIQRAKAHVVQTRARHDVDGPSRHQPGVVTPSRPLASKAVAPVGIDVSKIASDQSGVLAPADDAFFSPSRVDEAELKMSHSPDRAGASGTSSPVSETRATASVVSVAAAPSVSAGKLMAAPAQVQAPAGDTLAAKALAELAAAAADSAPAAAECLAAEAKARSPKVSLVLSLERMVDSTETGKALGALDGPGDRTLHPAAAEVVGRSMAGATPAVSATAAHEGAAPVPAAEPAA